MMADSWKVGGARQQGTELIRIWSFDNAKARSFSTMSWGAQFPCPHNACAWFAAHSCERPQGDEALKTKVCL